MVEVADSLEIGIVLPVFPIRFVSLVPLALPLLVSRLARQGVGSLHHDYLWKRQR